jgi:hypothetical protein
MSMAWGCYEDWGQKTLTPWRLIVIATIVVVILKRYFVLAITYLLPFLFMSTLKGSLLF